MDLTTTLRITCLTKCISKSNNIGRIGTSTACDKKKILFSQVNNGLSQLNNGLQQLKQFAGATAPFRAYIMCMMPACSPLLSKSQATCKHRTPVIKAHTCLADVLGVACTSSQSTPPWDRVDYKP